MAGDEHAGAAADGKVGIVGHLLDHHHPEALFVNPRHVVDGRIALPHLPTFLLWGIPFDMSNAKHVVMLWSAGTLLITVMLAPSGDPAYPALFRHGCCRAMRPYWPCSRVMAASAHKIAYCRGCLSPDLPALVRPVTPR